MQGTAPRLAARGDPQWPQETQTSIANRADDTLRCKGTEKCIDKVVVEERWLPRLWAWLRCQWQGIEKAVSPCEEIFSMGNLFSSVRICQARAYAIVANGALILTINQIAV